MWSCDAGLNVRKQDTMAPVSFCGIKQNQLFVLPILLKSA